MLGFGQANAARLLQMFFQIRGRALTDGNFAGEKGSILLEGITE
jgi:hypothetical protein